MKQAPDPRLESLLGGAALATLRQRLRRHFERDDPQAPARVIRVTGLDASGHEALAQLIGASAQHRKSLRVDLETLDATLRAAGIATSLRDALERLDGPIAHRASARADARARWAAVTGQCRHEALGRLLQTPAALGLLKRLARRDTVVAGQLIEQTEAVLRRLPAHGLPLAQLAAETLGDAHALDGGRPVATLVIAVCRRAFATHEDGPGDASAQAWQSFAGYMQHEQHEQHEESGPDRACADEDGCDERTRDEERSRDVWARAGVLVNELARPALFLNLPLHDGVAGFGTRGEPGYASLRQLLRSPPPFAVAGRDVFVCENPNVVAIAADRLGVHCAPLVCTDGMPAAAQRTLLGQLVRTGAHLRYHGDFDWAGVRIANRVMRAFAARPWRMGANDYEAAAMTAPHGQRTLENPAVAALWDPALAPAMCRRRVAIDEEAVAGTLIEDLDQSPRSSSRASSTNARR